MCNDEVNGEERERKRETKRANFPSNDEWSWKNYLGFMHTAVCLRIEECHKASQKKTNIFQRFWVFTCNLFLSWHAHTFLSHIRTTIRNNICFNVGSNNNKNILDKRNQTRPYKWWRRPLHSFRDWKNSKPTRQTESDDTEQNHEKSETIHHRMAGDYNTVGINSIKIASPL